MRRLFASLHHRNFKLFFFGQLVSVIGIWVHQIAETWLVWELTGSGTITGLVVAARFSPILALGLWGGVIADRYDRRRLLLVTQAIRGVAAGVVGVAALTGTATAGLVCVGAVVAGAANAIDNPTRRAFISQLVPRADLMNAVSLNSTVMSTSRVVAPLLAAGMIATVGAGWCFVFNAVSYIPVLGSLAAIRPTERIGAARIGRHPRQIRDALHYAWRDDAVFVPLVLVGVVSAFAWNWETLLAIHAERTFGGAAGTYGLLFSATSVGTLAGALRSAVSKEQSRRQLITITLAAGVCVLLVAAAPGVPATMVLLAAAGFATARFTNSSNATLQLNTDPSFHGRVMAMYSVLFIGTKGIGGALAGTLAEALSPRWGIAVGGVACLAIGAWAIRRAGTDLAAAQGQPSLAPTSAQSAS